MKNNKFHRETKATGTNIVDLLKARVNIVDVIGPYVPLKRQGRNWIGLSPFRDERTPSLVVFVDHFHDFGSGEHGDVIDFVQRMERVSFSQAVKILADRYGISGSGPVADRPTKPRHSEQTLVRAEQLVVGLYWRILRALETTKAELWGPEHEKAALATRTLTYWLHQIRGWCYLALNAPSRDRRSYWERVWSDSGREEAVVLLRKLPQKLVRECIAEVRQAQMHLAAAIVGDAGNSRKDAAA
jgi:hypothetical protein